MVNANGNVQPNLAFLCVAHGGEDTLGPFEDEDYCPEWLVFGDPQMTTMREERRKDCVCLTFTWSVATSTIVCVWRIYVRSVSQRYVGWTFVNGMNKLHCINNVRTTTFIKHVERTRSWFCVTRCNAMMRKTLPTTYLSLPAILYMWFPQLRCFIRYIAVYVQTRSSANVASHHLVCRVNKIFSAKGK